MPRRPGQTLHVSGFWEDGTRYDRWVSGFQELLEYREREIANRDLYKGTVVLRSGERVRIEDLIEKEE